MNRIIKRTLIIYLSLITILAGMAGAAYAITATDADEFITRSQFATDMSYLQTALDEAESSLMGKINTYRSTDIKFVTWDTPNKQAAATSGSNQGYHNGGNYYPRQATVSNFIYPYGFFNGSGRDKKNGRYTNYEMYRLWDGNYFFTKAMYDDDEASTNSVYYPTVNYAVPIENFPGWYLEVRLRGSGGTYASCLVAPVKLDPNSTTKRPAWTDVLTIRFKKDLFKYCGTQVTPLTTTKVRATTSCDYWYKDNATSYMTPFSYTYPNSTAEPRYSTYNVITDSWIDAETGDYMLNIGLRGCGLSDDGTHAYNYNVWLHNNNCTLNKIIPADNVEYVSGNTLGSVFARGSGSNSYGGIPDAAVIGSGKFDDPYWQYEFVDCANGLTYWHAYRPPSDTKPAGALSNPLPYGIHYSLPIVY